MTTQSAAPAVLHAWAIYLQATEEARRLGDRRTGTGHILLALFDDPSIEAVLGVSRCAPCPRSRRSKTSWEKTASAQRPRQRKRSRTPSSPTAARPRSQLPGFEHTTCTYATRECCHCTQNHGNFR